MPTYALYVPKQQIGVISPSSAVFVLRGGILSSVATIDFAEMVRRRLAENGQSKYGAAVNSGLPQDAIRNVLNGHIPRLNRVEQICRAISLELYIGPPRDVQVDADDAEPSRPLTRFDPRVQLPVRVLLPPAPDVYLMKSEEADQTKPAPVDLDDPQAFYALLHGHSMVPTGIGPADFCLVSPCAKLDPGQRVWLRDRKGREGLRWLIRLTAAGSRPSRTATRTWSPSGGSARTSTTAASSWRCTAAGWFRRTRFTGFPTGALAGSPVCGRRCSTGSRNES